MTKKQIKTMVDGLMDVSEIDTFDTLQEATKTIGKVEVLRLLNYAYTLQQRSKIHTRLTNELIKKGRYPK